METKFRIVKNEVRNGTNEITRTYYTIEKKFLFWWLDAEIPSVYYMVGSDPLLENRVHYFSTIEQANSAIERFFLNPFKENYKANRIIRALNSNSKEVYVNRSYVISRYAGRPCYEVSLSFDELKIDIDNRIRKVYKKVI